MYRLTIGRPGHQLTSLPIPEEYYTAAWIVVYYINGLRRQHQPKEYGLNTVHVLCSLWVMRLDD